MSPVWIYQLNNTETIFQFKYCCFAIRISFICCKIFNGTLVLISYWLFFYFRFLYDQKSYFDPWILSLIICIFSINMRGCRKPNQSQFQLMIHGKDYILRSLVIKTFSELHCTKRWSRLIITENSYHKWTHCVQ